MLRAILFIVLALSATAADAKHRRHKLTPEEKACRSEAQRRFPIGHLSPHQRDLEIATLQQRNTYYQECKAQIQ
jgi:hypothetical protein